MTRLLAAVAAVATFATPIAATAQRAPSWEGLWRNGSNSVRIKAARCGAGMCGRVVWASPKAQDDAARGGTEQLVGTELFHDFRREQDGLWYGQVYVPDIDQTFNGTIDLVDRNTLVGKGCLFANFGCKTQTWTRVR
jgi:uncharacterized protein (DUF2147 family)